MGGLFYIISTGFSGCNGWFILHNYLLITFLIYVLFTNFLPCIYFNQQINYERLLTILLKMYVIIIYNVILVNTLLLVLQGFYGNIELIICIYFLGIQHRDVYCIREDGSNVHPSKCPLGSRPDMAQVCNRVDCPPRYVVLDSLLFK